MPFPRSDHRTCSKRSSFTVHTVTAWTTSRSAPSSPFEDTVLFSPLNIAISMKLRAHQESGLRRMLCGPSTPASSTILMRQWKSLCAPSSPLSSRALRVHWENWVLLFAPGACQVPTVSSQKIVNPSGSLDLKSIERCRKSTWFCTSSIVDSSHSRVGIHSNGHFTTLVIEGKKSIHLLRSPE